MNDERRGMPSGDEGSDLAQLLRLAGPREPAPADRAARVRASVHAEWQQAVRARQRRVRVTWVTGALAAAALVLFFVRPVGRTVRTAPPVATLDAVEGTATVTLGGATPDARPGDALMPGARIDTTTTSRVRVRLGEAAWLRVNRATQVRLVSPTTLALDRGAIYLDAGQDADTTFEVQTPFGTVRDVGTEFEVLVDGTAATVRVREGRVRLSRNDSTHEVGAGDELIIDRGGRVDRRTIATSGWAWAWALADPSRFEIEGRSLHEFLEWLCRENAWRLAWADDAVERHAATTILHGSIDGLTADDALAAVLPASGVDHRLADGVLSVRRTPDDREGGR